MVLNVSLGLIFVLGLFTGTMNSILMKGLYQTHSPNAAANEPRFFTKPWFVSALMFVAMLCAFPIYKWQRARALHLGTASTDPDAGPLSWRMVRILALPGAFDLVGSSLQQMGLVVVPVSAYQMLKGSILLFSAILSVIFLGKRFRANHYAGVGVCVLALALVGYASVAGVSEAAGQNAPANSYFSLAARLAGIGCVVAGQVMCASQYVLEEHLLHGTIDAAPPMALVGLEGFWGCALLIPVLAAMQLLPGKDVGGVYENTQDSLEQVGESSQIQLLCVGFVVSVGLYNILGVLVTARASAVHHTFLDVSRTILVWLTSLGTHYLYSSQYGEAWTSASPLQAVGFVLLVAGQLVYEDMLPGFTFATTQEHEKHDTPMMVASVASTPLHRFVDSPALAAVASTTGKAGLLQRPLLGEAAQV